MHKLVIYSSRFLTSNEHETILQAIAYLTNGIVRDERCFYMEDQVMFMKLLGAQGPTYFPPLLPQPNIFTFYF